MTVVTDRLLRVTRPVRRRSRRLPEHRV